MSEFAAAPKGEQTSVCEWVWSWLFDLVKVGLTWFNLVRVCCSWPKGDKEREKVAISLGQKSSAKEQRKRVAQRNCKRGAKISEKEQRKRTANGTKLARWATLFVWPSVQLICSLCVRFRFFVCLFVYLN